MNLENHNDATFGETLSKMIKSLWFQRCCYLLGVLIILFYFYFYFTYIPVIHPDLNQLHFANINGENFWTNLIAKTFDLTMIENGTYRPRALGFMINYIDVNFQLFLYSLFPNMGMYLPFYSLSAILLVFAFYKMYSFIFPKWESAIVFLLATMPLFCVNFQVATYVYLRSAKLLVVSVGLLLILYTIKRLNVITLVSKKSLLKNIILGILFFVVMTLDEQIILVALMMFCISLVFSIKNRKISDINVIWAISLLLYFVFYLYFFKIIFQYYTPVVLGAHPHQIEGVISSYQAHIFTAIKIYYHVIANFWGGGTIGSILVLLISLCSLFNFMRFRSFYDFIIALSLICLGYLIVLADITAHPTIIGLLDLWDGMYFILSTCLFNIGVLFFSRTYALKNIYKFNIYIYICILGLFLNISQVEMYYGRHHINGCLQGVKPSENLSLDLYLKQHGR